jgi:small GTP-binding protein
MSADGPSLKVVFVGDAGVGKTSLSLAFMQDKIEIPSLATTLPTFCAKPIEVDGRTVELQIWDTAGQERYLSISKMYFRDTQVALVCATTETLESIPRWAGHVREASPQCRIFGVLTKGDMIPADDVPRAHTDLQQLVDQYGGQAYITSAVTKEGVGALLEGMAQVALAPEVQAETTGDVQLARRDARAKGDKKCSC